MLRIRAAWLFVFGLALSFLLSNPIAFAATEKTAAHVPNIGDRAVNAFADLINYVAHFFPASFGYGLSLIIVTILVRLVTVPLMYKSLKNSKKMQLLQPKMAELKQKFGSDAKKYQEEIMAMYKDEGVNPFGGCAPMLVQAVILFLFYRAIYTDKSLFEASFLWLKLGQMDHTFIFPILAAITSYFQQRLTMVQTDASTKMLQYIFPVMIFIFAWKTFSALPLYWTISNIFTIVQLYFTHVKPRQTGVVSK